jgi:hypothetical protein
MGFGLPIHDLVTLASDDVIAVAGVYGDGWVHYHGTVLRWNGEAWYDDLAPSVPALTAAWAIDRDDIWAVGDAGVSIHYNGLEWTEVPTPVGFDSTLLGVWARDGNSAWAVGTGGTIIRWDGSTWQTDATPTRLHLLEVGGNDEAVWAVGVDGAILRRAHD